MNKIIKWWNKIVLLDVEPEKKPKKPFATMTMEAANSLQLSKNGSYGSYDGTKFLTSIHLKPNKPKEKDPYAIK